MSESFDIVAKQLAALLEVLLKLPLPADQVARQQLLTNIQALQAALEVVLKLPLPADEVARMQLLAILQAPQPAAVSIDDVIVGDKVGGDKIDGDKIVDPQGTVNVSGDARVYGPTIGINLGTIIYRRAPREDERRQLVWYLEALANKLYRLPLRGLDERLDRGDGLAMPRIYVALATTTRRSAVQALSAHPRLVLLGDPGSGKSMFMRHLAWVMAQCVLDPAHGQTLLPNADRGRVQLPILLPLRTLAEYLDRDGVSPMAVMTALLAVLREYGGDEAEALLREALHSGAALLLFDGLDEVPLDAIPGTTASRMTVVQTVCDFCQTYRQAHVVITCRTRAFDVRFRDALGWPVETLARFTRAQMRAFVAAWYAELATNGQIEPAQATRLSATLLNVVKDSPKLSAMAGTPLLLTMMALVLYNKGELPRDRPQLYEQVLELLLGQWDKVRDGQSLAEAIGLPDWDSKRIRPLLDQLSYQAHLKASSRDGRGRLARGLVYDALIDFFKQAKLPDQQAWAAAGRCLEYFNQRSGLLVPDDVRDSYVFVHLTLQEHCAGRYIVLAPDAANLVLRHRADDRWREPIFLGLGVAQQYNPMLIDRVLSDLIDRQEGKPDKPIERWLRDLLLADEIGQDRDWGYLQALRINVDRLQRDLKDKLHVCLTQSLPLDSRIEAGATLGQLGALDLPVTGEDWRHKLDQRNEDFGRPAGYWCYIRPGAYRIGGWDNREREATINLPAFWIARFPIAVAQFAPFVTPGYGANAKQWWTANGWEWKQGQRHTQPYHWSEAPYNDPNQPVIGVTWYEATAFCAWLSTQLEDTLPAGYAVRLPTEAEWEAAAACDAAMNRRKYPWGDNEPTTERAIYGASNLGHPAPIGCCPAGAAACGALDMAGNVWEMTTSSFRNFSAQSGTVEADFPTGEGDVSWRGGSYYQGIASIRCGARLRNHPDAWVNDNSFRLVVALRSD